MMKFLRVKVLNSLLAPPFINSCSIIALKTDYLLVQYILYIYNNTVYTVNCTSISILWSRVTSHNLPFGTSNQLTRGISNSILFMTRASSSKEG